MKVHTVLILILHHISHFTAGRVVLMAENARGIISYRYRVSRIPIVQVARKKNYILIVDAVTIIEISEIVETILYRLGNMALCYVRTLHQFRAVSNRIVEEYVHRAGGQFIDPHRHV